MIILPGLFAFYPAPQAPEAGLIPTLKDVQKAYNVLHQIDDQAEMLPLVATNDDRQEARTYLSQCLKTCQGLKTHAYTDKELATQIRNYLDGTINDYQKLYNGRLDSNEYKSEFRAHDTHRAALADFLVKKCALDHFVHLTETSYWKTIDKKNYIRSGRYDAYLKLLAHHLPEALNLLDSIYRECPEFQEKTIYQLEAADQYEINNHTLKDGSDQAIKRYRSIIDEKKYSLYLYETWVKWRAVTQQHAGLSKSSDIPNDHYDQVRDLVADVILSHIQQNEHDEMAINQFLVIVTHDIVFRFGDYPYGNQNTVEYHQLFDH